MMIGTARLAGLGAMNASLKLTYRPAKLGLSADQSSRIAAMYFPTRAKTTPMTVRGVVAGSYFKAPSGSTPSSTSASYYQNVKVCVDANNNVVCDSDETSTFTDASGAFFLHSLYTGPLVAEVSTSSTNSGNTSNGRVAFRAAFEQVAEGAVNAGHPAVSTPAAADVVITQIGPATVDVTAAGQLHTVEVELFRAENRYVSSEPTTLRTAELESVD